MAPPIVHPVLVNAVVLATPTSPVVADLVQVTAGPPRMAKLDIASADWAAAERVGTRSAPNAATTADSAVSRITVDMVFSLAVGAKTGPSEGPFRYRTLVASLSKLEARARGGHRSEG